MRFVTLLLIPMSVTWLWTSFRKLTTLSLLLALKNLAALKQAEKWFSASSSAWLILLRFICFLIEGCGIVLFFWSLLLTCTDGFALSLFLPLVFEVALLVDNGLLKERGVLFAQMFVISVLVTAGWETADLSTGWVWLLSLRRLASRVRLLSAIIGHSYNFIFLCLRTWKELAPSELCVAKWSLEPQTKHLGFPVLKNTFYVVRSPLNFLHLESSFTFLG